MPPDEESIKVGVPVVNMSIQKETLHYLYFPAQLLASKVAKELRAGGFDTQVRLGADGVNWLILVRIVGSPIDLALQQSRELFEKIARDNGGEYDGWEIALRPDDGRHA